MVTCFSGSQEGKDCIKALKSDQSFLMLLIVLGHFSKLMINELSNLNFNFSKQLDLLQMADGPDFFHYNLLQKYH